MATNTKRVTLPQQQQSSAQERIWRQRSPSFQQLSAGQRRDDLQERPRDVVVDCGWGRLVIGHTFSDEAKIATALQQETEGERNIALYVANPHIVLSHSPQTLFLDPSDTLRLWMNNYRPPEQRTPGIVVRRALSKTDAGAINTIYAQRKMVPVREDRILGCRNSRQQIYLIAEDQSSGEILGTVMGLNHIRLFNDPERGSSLWCLAVSPDCTRPAVGEALVRHLIEYFQTRGCNFLDLSVMHNNSNAKALYGKLHFRPIKTFAVKCKNAINTKLFIGPDYPPDINPYAQIIIDDALARGIDVEIEDAEHSLFTLIQGGRRIRCYQSLTELTSAYAMTLCQNKLLTHRTLARAGLATPAFAKYRSPEQAAAFIAKHGSIVVKPMDSEQGRGISVGIDNSATLETAVNKARLESAEVLLESFHPGDDLRILVIDFEVVAAAIRRPAEIQGDGSHSIATLINKQSRRRQADTQGESRIPIDDETLRCVQAAGFGFDDILPAGQQLRVRRTANLHTGGTLIDVTEQLHPQLAAAAIRAARAIDIPVTGIDMIVQDPAQPDYVIIEANERPGLANHEPHPTAQRFVDLLFPLSRPID